MRIKIKFLKNWKVYQPGEVCGKEEALANELVRLGYAEILDEKYQTAGAKLRALRQPPERRDVQGPEQTKSPQQEARDMIQKATGKEIKPGTAPKPDRSVNLATGEETQKQQPVNTQTAAPTVKANGPRKPRGPYKKKKK